MKNAFRWNERGNEPSVATAVLFHGIMVIFNKCFLIVFLLLVTWGVTLHHKCKIPWLRTTVYWKSFDFFKSFLKIATLKWSAVTYTLMNTPNIRTSNFDPTTLSPTFITFYIQELELILKIIMIIIWFTFFNYYLHSSARKTIECGSTAALSPAETSVLSPLSYLKWPVVKENDIPMAKVQCNLMALHLHLTCNCQPVCFSGK